MSFHFLPRHATNEVAVAARTQASHGLRRMDWPLPCLTQRGLLLKFHLTYKSYQTSRHLLKDAYVRSLQQGGGRNLFSLEGNFIFGFIFPAPIHLPPPPSVDILDGSYVPTVARTTWLLTKLSLHSDRVPAMSSVWSALHILTHLIFPATILSNILSLAPFYR